MADPQTTTDAPVKPVDATNDVHAAANTVASSNALNEIKTTISGPAASADGSKQPADTTKAPTDTASHDPSSDSPFDGFANFVSDAWKGTTSAASTALSDTTSAAETAWKDTTGAISDVTSGASNLVSDAYSGITSSFSSWENTASNTVAGDNFLKSVDDIFAGGTVDNVATTAGTSDQTNPPAGKAASVDVKDGQINVNNKELTATGNNGNDVVTNKGTGEVTSRDANHVITDKNGDVNTTIDPHSKEVTTQAAGGTFTRRMAGQETDPSKMRPGETASDDHSITYKPYTSEDGGGIASADTKTGVITLNGYDGDKVVIDPRTKEIDFTPKGGQTEHLTVDQYEQKFGKKEFAGYLFQPDGSVTNQHDHVNISAKLAKPPGAPANDGTTPVNAPAADVEATVKVTKTDPNTGEIATATVNPDGTEDLRVANSSGKMLSNTEVNPHDPAHAYEQFDDKGAVIANYDINSGIYQGNGFSFDDSGLSIADGNVFIGDDGTFTADPSTDFVSTDDSLSNFYTGSGSNYDTIALNSSGNSGLSTDVEADVASQLAQVQADPSSASIDELLNLQQLTGGKLNLTPLIDRAEAREEHSARRQERMDGRGDRNDDNTVLDFAASDIYGSSAA